MKTIMVKTVLVACLMVGSIAHAAEEASKGDVREDVRQLLTLMGAGEIGMKAMEQMIDSFRQSLPWVPQEFWNDFIQGVDPADLIELSIDPYVRHLSHEDIRDLIAFYQTPLGKRLARAMPAITHEGMLAGQEWGQQLAEDVLERLQEEGYQ